MRPVSKKQNFEIVARVATCLQELVEEVVFVGGSSAAFLITDEDIVTVRPTLDVDIIVEVMNLPDYYRFENRLRKLGFEPDPDGPMCRFLVDGIIVDVLTTKTSWGFQIVGIGPLLILPRNIQSEISRFVSYPLLCFWQRS